MLMWKTLMSNNNNKKKKNDNNNNELYRPGKQQSKSKESEKRDKYIEN